MHLRLAWTVTVASLCSALLISCAGGGSSSTHPAGLIPASGNSAGALGARGGGRRPDSVPSCSGLGTGAFVGGGFENVADGAYSGVLEGNSNEVCDEESAVGGGYYNFISSGANTSYYSWIGSGYDNTIGGNGYQSVIGGGNVNTLTAPNSVIGGGNQNTLAASDSVIAGGSSNSDTSAASYSAIGGGSGSRMSSEYGVISGGNNNNVSADKYGAIGGGNGNSVSGHAAVVGGGAANGAGGQWATVPGGVFNVASGTASFAAGYNSAAATDGAYVWSDYASGAAKLASTSPNQFLARASGGFSLWTNAANTVGATLPSGSGTWASASDRKMKTDVVRIDDAAVLDRVSRLPISKWSYISERGVHHLGPMAQDFYAAFGVGEDDKHITSIDEDGVALAAIKALHAENAQLRAQQRNLRAQLAAITALQSQQALAVARLSAAVASLRTTMP